MFHITGSNATDFAVKQLAADTAAVGDEAMTFIGNDIAYGRTGRIESLLATEAFGDVETNDLSRDVSNSMEDIKDWVATYNARFDRAYFFTPEFGQVFVLHRGFLDKQQQSPVSPWSRWKTAHAMAFQPTAVMAMKRPTDGLDVIYMGDSSGNIYQLEGSGGQDGGSSDIKAERLSGVIRMPNVGPVYDVSGWVTYRRIFPATLTITLEWGGTVLENHAITVSLDAAPNAPVWGGGLYWSNDQYWSTPFKGRFSRQIWSGAGKSEQLQVRASIDGATDFFIEEIGLDFAAK